MQKSVVSTPVGVLVVSVVLLVASFSFLPFHGAFAQDSAEDDRLTILITASRFAETADQTLVPVTVITRKEIEEKQASTVEEVLRSVPGVTFGNSGGVGKITSLFLRGTNSNHVLVLIDGVKVGAADSGTTRFENLPLDQIERIEVVRGPRSSLYGSEAIGGVIQIFTRKGDGKLRPRFSVSTGTHDTYKGEFGVSGGTETAWYNLGVSSHSTDGYNACRGNLSAGCFANEPDEDGYENRSVSVRGGISLTDSFDLEGNFLGSDSDTEFDGGSENEEEHISRIASVKATLQANEQWQTSLLVGRSKDRSDNTRNGARHRIAETLRDQINWQNTIVMSENRRIVAGIDYLNDQTDTASRYTTYDESRHNVGIFGLFQTEINANDLGFSLRNDDNEQFGDHTTGSIGWGRDIGSGNRITASYGTAFKAPTFTDLYGFGGNLDLDPETSKSVDLGFLHSGDHVRWSVNLYRTKIDNLIIYRSGVNENIEKAEVTGIEFSADTTFGGWDIASTLTWQDAKETKGNNKDKSLLRRPRKKLDLDFSRRFGKHLFGVNVYAQGASKDVPPDSNAGFATVNLRGEIRIERNWSLGLKINNLLAKEHETVAFYPQDGINFLATLRYAPANGNR